MARILRNAGHEVFTPTLTGTADRLHLGSPNVTMTTHIQDIVATIEFEDLRDVVLVGHSYGGLPVIGASDKIPDRLSHIVLLDACVAKNGESFKDISPDFYQYVKSLADTYGDGWLIPIPENADMGITDPKDLAWVTSKLTAAGSMNTLHEPITLTNPHALSLPRTYVICTQNGTQSDFVRYIEKPLKPNWTVRYLESGHDAMVTVPEEFANLILNL